MVLPLSSHLYITPAGWPLGEIGCVILAFFIDVSMHGTLFALMTISLDRFLLVYLEYPKYIKHVTRRRVYKIVAVGWIFALSTAILEIGFWEKSKGLDETAASIDYSVSFLYQLRKRLRKYKHSLKTSSGAREGMKTAGIGRSASSGKVVSDHADNAASASHPKPHSLSFSRGTTANYKIELVHSASSGDLISMQVASSDRKKGISYSVIKNRYIKPGVTLVGLVSAMAICMLPYSFYVIIIESGCEHCNDFKLIYGLLLMQFCNACLDPFIYVLTRKKMRTFYCNCFLKKKPIL